MSARSFSFGEWSALCPGSIGGSHIGAPSTGKASPASPTCTAQRRERHHRHTREGAERRGGLLLRQRARRGYRRTQIKLRQKVAADTFVDAVDHDLYEILASLPNPETTAYSFKLQMMFDLLLHSAAFAEVVRVDGRVAALWRLDPSRVTSTGTSGAGSGGGTRTTAAR